jgi:hypothetical protein
MYIGCWCGILYNVLVQMSELLLAFLGPISSPFLCHLHLLAKNVIIIQYTLQETIL